MNTTRMANSIDPVAEMLTGIINLARAGKYPEALSLATELREAYPDDPCVSTARRRVYNYMSLADALAKVEENPTDRSLYLWVCLGQSAVGDFECSLAASDAGLRASGGSEGSLGMYEEHLIFLGAWALFNLGRYREALDRLKPLWPGYTSPSPGGNSTPGRPW